MSKSNPGDKVGKRKVKAGLDYPLGVTVSNASSSTSSPTPLVQKKGDAHNSGLVQHNDPDVPQEHDDMSD